MLLPLLHLTTALYIPPSASCKCLLSPSQIPCPSTCYCFYFGNPNKTWSPVNIVFLMVLWCNILHRLAKRRGYHEKVIFTHLVLPVPNTYDAILLNAIMSHLSKLYFLLQPSYNLLTLIRLISMGGLKALGDNK